MNAIRNHSSRAGTLMDAGNLPILVDPQQGTDIANALKRSTLKLPASGSYWAELRGGQLDIYEAQNGVRGWSIDGHRGGANVVVGDKVAIVGSFGSAVNEIVLHLSPQTPRRSMRSLEELSAPVDLLDRYAALRAKQSPTMRELQERQELLDQIRKEFRRNDSRRPSRRSSRTSSATSGESSGRSVSCGG
jgi:hypothetical protein